MARSATAKPARAKPGADVVERFAPSPNGALHLGHAFSALLASDAARAAGGRFLLRIEDLDAARCRPEYEDAMRADLAWLGIDWEEPVMRQSERRATYADALASLEARGMIYPCYCSRKEIQAALAAPQEGDAEGLASGPDGPVYPGVCRDLSAAQRAERAATGRPAALRLDMRKAIAALGGRGVVGKLSYKELGRTAPPDPVLAPGRVSLDPAMLTERIGDVVLARKDFPASYHLAVVVDDAAQGVTHVTRGADLAGAAPLHRLLQALLGRPTPSYRHHRLIRDDAGRRLAKRDRDAGVETMRAAGWTPAEIRQMVGLA